ncbi:hypothetical protein P389DRAFT_148214, partial [Cystobasidium minutum MCA 4210]|uniref:uncharacterized protein n=1 Tax=Cystobasidium minutum MCA 4210 TaxID=1397322 RepID=UPI0034CD1684
GGILIAPLVKQFPTRTILAAAVWGFGVMTAILLIVDASMSRYCRPSSDGLPHPSLCRPVQYDHWDANAIFPIWGIAGIFYGMVELIRRVM